MPWKFRVLKINLFLLSGPMKSSWLAHNSQMSEKHREVASLAAHSSVDLCLLNEHKASRYPDKLCLNPASYQSWIQPNCQQEYGKAYYSLTSSASLNGIEPHWLQFRPFYTSPHVHVHVRACV